MLQSELDSSLEIRFICGKERSLELGYLIGNDCRDLGLKIRSLRILSS